MKFSHGYEEIRARDKSPQPAPVDAQGSEQLGTEHDITVLASLAAPNMNDHALAVDIADLQCATSARRAPVA
jgi:hypothetical protein